MAILVTGADGNVGREVVRALLERGEPVRAASRDPERARARLGGAAEVVRLDFADSSTFGPAVAGCRAVFLLRPPAISKVRRTLLPFVDEARARGADHVVFLSVAGAGENPLVPHHAIEKHLRDGTAPYTLLRPGFFAQNLQDAYLRDLREDDRLYVPAGAGKVAFVDLVDVADVAVDALLRPEAHTGQAWTLTGPVAVTFAELATWLTEVLGRPIRYEPASIGGYLRHLRARGLPWGQAAVQAVLHMGLRLGQAEAVDPTLERLLGRPGRPVRAYIEANADLWRIG